MAASQTTTTILSSKMSASLRHLLLRHSTARSTAIASAAAVSLTGKLPADNSPAIIFSNEKPKIVGINVDYLNFVGRPVDWPAFYHQQIVIEAVARGDRKVDLNDEEDGDFKDSEGSDFDMDDIDDDDFDDEDDEDFDDDDEE
ncbi:hypothetical protein BVRB_4g087030 [Beta vulgaris subsp. vulgaris]|uniref:Uncharacterized protein n=1 Tax=Beta vulgaris subsp. vulgaris TaxID=3555 RepID=A0A0J8CM23_BETVV|nr:hypothetical protein BVRB_4g087030 [Beta vulgaris subsp. vulgaris]